MSIYNIIIAWYVLGKMVAVIIYCDTLYNTSPLFFESIHNGLWYVQHMCELRDL